MKIRVAALSTLIALACAAPILAQLVDGPGLTATGKVVSTAEKVVLLEAGPVSARRPADGTNGGQSPAPALTSSPSPASPPEDAGDTELPRTASPLPFVGLLGLVAFLGSVFLRALERRRSQEP
jgi:hypothetical protein